MWWGSGEIFRNSVDIYFFLVGGSWREMCFLVLLLHKGSPEKKTHLTEKLGFSHKKLHLFVGFLLKACLVHLYLEPAFDCYLIYWQLGAQPQKNREPEDQGF